MMPIAPPPPKPAAMPKPTFGAPLPGNAAAFHAPTATTRYPGAMAAVNRAFPGGIGQQRAWIKSVSAYKPKVEVKRPPPTPAATPAFPPSGSFNPQREQEVEE